MMPFRVGIAVLICLLSVSPKGRAANTPSLVIPFKFVENRGQVDPSVLYIGTGPEYKAWFRATGVVLQRNATVIGFAFDRGPAGPDIRVEADQAIGARANYLLGRDARGWQTGLPLYGRVIYKGIWPGTEITYKADRGRLKAEYIVSPLADSGRIALRFDGRTEIRTDGSLLIHGATGDFVEGKPVLYQISKGRRSEIAGGFTRHANGSIGFWAAAYDRAQPLVIDPAILISGYFGGSSEDDITAVTVDSANNTIVAGWTSSANLPASNGYEKKYGGSVDAFVASFLPNGGGLNYCTYLGGSGDDRAFALVTDTSRNVYITGWTSSVNFPLTSPLRSHLGGTRDAFVAKLSAAGSALLYSTYLGGSGVDAGYSIALFDSNQAVVVGDTNSINFPVTSGTIQAQSGGGQDAFVAILGATGNVLTLSTYLGGAGADHAASVAVGPNGGIFVGGYTWSTNFPVVGVHQQYSLGGQQGFVAKISPTRIKILWSTYLGGSGGSIGTPQEVTSVGIDQTPAYNVIVGGVTASANFPVTAGAFQVNLAGATDGFVARLSNSSGNILQATYLGGTLVDTVSAVTTDFCGDIYVTGSTSSWDFPVQWPLQAASAGSMDAFVTKLNPSLSTLMFSTFLGGSGSDQANAIAVDAETAIVVAGQTGSGNFPVTGTMQTFLPSFLTSFVTKIRPNFTLGVAYPYSGQMEFTADPWHVMTDTASTSYGLSTDIPIVGDWTGTGVKRIGIFRNGTWILDTNGNGIIDAADQTIAFGQAGDMPIVGDWRGTGHIALGLYRNGTFILDLSGHLSGVPTGLSDATYSNFGLATDIPVAADWSGSGTAKVGVFRNGTWLVDYNGTGVASRTWTYGQTGDVPVVGDWDSSGNPPKIGVFRSGLWILDYDGDHVLTTPGVTEMSLGFGFAGYTPLVF